MDRLGALGHTTHDIPKKGDSEVEDSLHKNWNLLVNKNQELNERSEVIGHFVFYMKSQISLQFGKHSFPNLKKP